VDLEISPEPTDRERAAILAALADEAAAERLPPPELDAGDDEDDLDYRPGSSFSPSSR
jgi:hypothetical protein